MACLGAGIVASFSGLDLTEDEINMFQSEPVIW
jgi:hypothetical protein